MFFCYGALEGSRVRESRNSNFGPTQRLWLYCVCYIYIYIYVPGARLANPEPSSEDDDGPCALRLLAPVIGTVNPRLLRLSAGPGTRKKERKKASVLYTVCWKKVRRTMDSRRKMFFPHDHPIHSASVFCCEVTNLVDTGDAMCRVMFADAKVPTQTRRPFHV